MRRSASTLVICLLLAVCAKAQVQVLQVANQGSSGWFDVSPATGLAPASITVEAWVTYDDTTITPPPSWVFPTLLRKNLSSGGEEYFLRVEAANSGNKVLRWAVRTAGGMVIANWSFGSGELASWTHVAASWDGSTSRILINGVEVATASGSGALVDNAGALKVGAGDTAPNAAYELWNGNISNLRIWSTARSAPEVVASMFQPLLSWPGLEASWPLDGDLLDWSGHGRDGATSTPVTFTSSSLPVQLYQVNSPSAQLDINGVVGGVFSPAQLNSTVGSAEVLTASSDLSGTLFDIALAIPQPLVPMGGGAFSTPGGQIVNMDFSAPSLTMLFGGSLATPFVPYTGTVSLPFSVPAPLSFSAQMIVIDPSHPDGFVLSGGVEYSAL